MVENFSLAHSNRANVAISYFECAALISFSAAISPAVAAAADNEEIFMTLTLLIQKKMTQKEREKIVKQLENEGWCVSVQDEEFTMAELRHEDE